MNPIIIFFRDYLSGTTYTITTVLCSVFICACLGYLIDKKQKQEQEQAKYTNVASTNGYNPNNLMTTSTNNYNTQRNEPEVLMEKEEPQNLVMNTTSTPMVNNNPAPIEEKPIDQIPEQPIEELTGINDTPIENTQELQKIQAPIPIKNTIEKNPKGIEAPLLPTEEEKAEPISNPIPVIK